MAELPWIRTRRPNKATDHTAVAGGCIVPHGGLIKPQSALQWQVAVLCHAVHGHVKYTFNTC